MKLNRKIFLKTRTKSESLKLTEEKEEIEEKEEKED
jgi:hypothetical protein